MNSTLLVAFLMFLIVSMQVEEEISRSFLCWWGCFILSNYEIMSEK